MFHVHFVHLKVDVANSLLYGDRCASPVKCIKNRLKFSSGHEICLDVIQI
jgi:hypothetical protein